MEFLSNSFSTVTETLLSDDFLSENANILKNCGLLLFLERRRYSK